MSDRRTQLERRHTNDRRRATGARTTAVEICHSVLRVAIVTRSDGNSPDTVATRTIRWRNESASFQPFHSAGADEELVNAFRRLVAEEKLAGTAFRITLGGEICVTRVVSGSVDYVRREMTHLEERSQRYLSLGAGRKAIAGDIRKIDARHEHALLAVSNQKTLDLLIHIAETVGVRIESVEPSLVALGRVVEHTHQTEDEPFIVMHVDEQSVELGICYRGKLLLDYRPSDRNAVNHIGQIVRQHLPRLQRYCTRHYSFLEKPLRKILVSGDPASAEETVASFVDSDTLLAEETPLDRCETTWTFPDDIPGSDMAAALGAALTFLPNEVGGLSPNLMEHVIARTRKPMRPVLIRSLLPMAAVLLIAAALLGVNRAQDGRRDALQQQLEELAPAQAKTIELRLTRGSIEHRLSHLRSLESALTRRRWAGVIAGVGQCMPNDVWLDRMSIQDGHEVQLAGASYADSGIYEFVRWLEAAPTLDGVALDGTRPGQTSNGPSTNFDIKLTLTNSDDYERLGK